MEGEVTTMWDRTLIMVVLAFVQIGVWYGLNWLISKHMGRNTYDDIKACIDEKVVGPAIVRAGIHISTAWMVTSGFARWV